MADIFVGEFVKFIGGIAIELTKRLLVPTDDTRKHSYLIYEALRSIEKNIGRLQKLLESARGEEEESVGARAGLLDDICPDIGMQIDQVTISSGRIETKLEIFADENRKFDLDFNDLMQRGMLLETIWIRDAQDAKNIGAAKWRT